ncbi:MAG: methyltransferase [Pseudomonadota bacterium]
MTEKLAPLTTLIACAALLTICQTTSATETKEAILKAMAGDHRSIEHKARDEYRHPLETLTFFGLESDMTVVEIWPGGAGWYTEILAPVLRDKGKLYAAHFPADSEVPFFKSSLESFKAKMAARPDVYDKVVLTELQPPKKREIAPAGSADRVFTFRNVHNWMRSGHASAVFKAMHRALKKGGILGVVEHRGTAGTEQDPEARSGYVTEAYAINLAEQAGFKLVEKSEVNANPADVKSYPDGVWTLPPSLRLGDKGRDKYLAIGESDRMTLKFIKP